MIFLSEKTHIPPDQKLKQGINVFQTRLINSSTSPFRFHGDPDLHILHTRVSHILTPGSKKVFQAVSEKNPI